MLSRNHYEAFDYTAMTTADKAENHIVIVTVLDKDCRKTEVTLQVQVCVIIMGKFNLGLFIFLKLFF